jgi:hypothetical protein
MTLEKAKCPYKAHSTISRWWVSPQARHMQRNKQGWLDKRSHKVSIKKLTKLEPEVEAVVAKGTQDYERKGQIINFHIVFVINDQHGILD